MQETAIDDDNDAPAGARQPIRLACAWCGELFTSSHKGNRMCQKCKSRDNNAGVFGW